MILVVDDDMLIVEVIRKWLEQEGHEVASCQDGKEAYDRLRASACSCMLLDIHMPLINGIELLLLLQAEGISVPTILMAGRGDFGEDEMKQFENVVAFMPKPFEMREMVEMVRKVTSGSVSVRAQ